MIQFAPAEWVGAAGLAILVAGKRKRTVRASQCRAMGEELRQGIVFATASQRENVNDVGGALLFLVCEAISLGTVTSRE